MAIESITVPDFGDVQEITVVEVYVAQGDRINPEDPVVALESEKAVMDIPSPLAGVITEIRVKTGDTVASGDTLALVETADTAAMEPSADQSDDQQGDDQEREQRPTPAEASPEAAADPATVSDTGQSDEAPITHASPSVRAYAREQGVELTALSGSGPKGRITREDIDRQLKTAAAPTPAASAGAAPETTGTSGDIEEIPLGRIQRISGPHLQRSWQSIPHVTHFDEADITALEAFRKQLNDQADDDLKLSPLVFVIKAVVATLKTFPLFNASLGESGDTIILKHHYHLGIAVDTENGLVVPVVKHADRRGIRDIAGELARLSGAARQGKLAIPDIQGATFTISSLGGIGGTGFTPIVNAPQVAILGLSRSYQKPIWDGAAFVPQLTLPFSLSYDHRVIDGAEAARFCRSLATTLTDLRRALL